jgi:hypothetical protein
MAEKTGKILRGCRAMWLTFDNKGFTCLGKDSDDMSIDTNPDTEQTKNVQGETTFNHNGYTPSLSNDSYLARYEDAIYPNLQNIVNTLAVDDETIGATMIVTTLDQEVKDATGATTLTGTGYSVPVKVVVDNDGGSTSGYGIPFTVYEDGARTQGTVSVTDKVPTFTAGGASSASLD